MSKHEELVKSLRNHENFYDIPGRPRDVLCTMDDAADALEAQEREIEGLRKDAALGRVAMRFVDRAGDVHPAIDDAETICAEFHAAMEAELGKHLPAAMKGAPHG